MSSAPFGARTIVDILERRSLESPNDIAFTYLQFDGNADEISLSYSTLEARARAVAQRVADQVARGERALLLYPQGIEYIIAFLGCLLAGVVAVPAYPPDPTRLARTLPRLRAVAADAEVGIVLTTRTIAGMAEGLLLHAPELAGTRWLATDDVTPHPNRDTRMPRIEPEAAAFLQYTSGSTSRPRAVVLTHANLMANQAMIQAGFGHRAGDVVVGWLPLYHDMGLIGNVLQPLYLGLHCALMAPHAFLQRPARWLEAVTRFGATTSGGPNFAYDLCVRKIDAVERSKLDLSRWRVAFNGAEPVRAATLERFVRAFAPRGFARESFLPCYGLAEATLLVSGGPARRGWCERPVDREALAAGRVEAPREVGLPLVGCGRAADGIELRIVDPATREVCPPTRVGEIWLRGPSVARGYRGQPEASAETFEARLAGSQDAEPWLRTGDLGFVVEGELFVTGRHKDLIIVRGRNLYPQDLEATVEASHPALRPGSSAAFVLDVDAEVERLAVCVELDPRRAPAELEQVIAAIQAAVLDEHEVSPASVVLLRPGALPKTSSGKVQRRACRAELLAGTLEVLARSEASTPEAAARHDMDAATLRLAELLAPHLARAPRTIDPSVSLAAFGLDSLAAVEIAATLAEAEGVEVPLAELLAGPSLERLAARLAELAQASPARARARVASDAGERSEHAASPGQHALWILHRLDPTSSAYHLAAALELEGPLELERLRAALRALVDRHPALRTTLPAREGRPICRVAAPGQPLAFTLEQAETLSEDELCERLDAAARAPFDLEQGPLFRASLWQRGGRAPVLLLAVHHVIADLHAVAVLLRELGLIHAALAAGRVPELAPLEAIAPTQLDDAAVERLWTRWRAALRPPLPELALPSDHPHRGTSSQPARRVVVQLEPALGTRLRALAARCRTTPFVVLLAVHQVFVARLTGQREFAVGVPSSERPGALAAHVDYLVHPLPIRADLRDSPSFEALVERVKHTLLAAISDRALPLATIVERINPERSAGRTPLFQTLVTLHASREPGLDALALGLAGARLRLGDLEARGRALGPMAPQFDLRVSLAELEQGLGVALEVPAEAWTERGLARLAERWTTLVAAALRNPESEVESLALVGPDEARELAGFNATTRPLALPWLHEAAAARASDDPHAIAARSGAETLTRIELHRRARGLAQVLHRLGVGPDVRVGVCLERGLDLIVALLGVLEAGGAILPLDPEYPRARLEYMARDAGIPVLIGGESSPHLELEGVERVDIHRLGRLEQLPELEVSPQISGEHLAYVIYTSGSTGAPKGAMNSHAGIANRLAWAQCELPITSTDVVLQKTPNSFDVSIWELFWPLWAGAELVFARPGGHLDPAYLAALVVERGVTTLHFVPSMLQVFLDHADRPPMPSLRRVLCSGEALPADLRDRALRELGVPLFNLYGPAEVAIEATAWPCSSADGPSVPIGRPIANLRTHVLDAELRELPIGCTGELHLAGVGVGRGYVGRPALSAERYVPDPFGPPGTRLYRTGDLARWRHDGVLEFLGRVDQQIKLRGVRIELGEIEACLRTHPSIRDAVASVHEEQGVRRLVAWFVCDESPAPTPAELRAFVGLRLPDAMIPALFLPIAAIPRSLSGKVDRRELPRPPSLDGESRVAGRAASTPTQALLVEIWARVLGRASVGIDDDFFALGGDSILAMQVVSEALRVGLVLRPRQLFESPSIAALAERATPLHIAAHVPSAVGEVALAPMQRWLLSDEFSQPEHFDQAVLVELAELPSPTTLRAAFAALIARHDALRQAFVRGPGGWQRHASEARPEVPIEWLDAADDAALGELALRLHAPFALDRPPLLRAALIRGPGRPRLAIVAHHLVIDGVSWRIVLGDLAAGLAGRLPTHPATSFLGWTEALARWAQRDAGERAQRWLAMPCVRDELVTARGEGPCRERDTWIDAATTRGWLDACAHAGVGLDELLLAALASWCVRGSGREGCTIDVETHGRGELDGVLASECVGWLTALAPVHIPVEPSTGILDALACTRQALRERPAPESFGALVCFDPRLERREALAARARPALCFNYLGSLDFACPGLRLIDPAFGPLRDANQRPGHVLTLDAGRFEGRLLLHWTGDAGLDPRALERAEACLLALVGEASERLVRDPGLLDAHDTASLGELLDADQLASVLAQLQ